MKTLKFFLVISFSLLTLYLDAQLKVISNGNVGVGTITTPLEKLHINGSIRGNQTAGSIKIQTEQGYTIIGQQNSSFTQFYNSSGNFYFDKGVNVRTGKYTSYDNVNLELCVGSNFIPKMTINYSDGNVGIGRIARQNYNLDVAGLIASNGVLVISDIRYKDNIKPMDKSFNKITLLNPITFTYKKDMYKTPNDAANDSSDTFSQDMNEAFSTQTRYGFSAQELLKVFPDLVIEDEDGFLSADYIGLIPVLVQSIKELSNNHRSDSLKIVDLQNRLVNIEDQLKECCGISELKSTQISSVVEVDSYALPALYQNSPNPFNENTTIAYYLPTTIVKANLYIYDMQGKQIKAFPITSRENGSIIINGYEMKPGIYLYSLIADGNEINTKRMILTE